MKNRKIRNIDTEVSESGLGAMGISGSGEFAIYGSMDEAKAHDCLQAYIDGGGNFIDTARRYNSSEQFIGSFLKKTGLRDQLVIASKTHQLEAEGIREELQQSLDAMGIDCIDLYYIHFPPEDADEMNRVLDVYDELKGEGKIKAIAASIKGPSVMPATQALCRQYIKTGRIDALQIIFSILRQDNRAIFDEAKEAGVSLIGRTVMESGLLTGKYAPGHKFPEDDWRGQRGQAEVVQFVLEEVKKLGENLPDTFENVSQLAVKYALDEPGLTAIIPGGTSPKHMQANTAIANLSAISPELRNELVSSYSGRSEEFNYLG